MKLAKNLRVRREQRIPFGSDISNLMTELYSSGNCEASFIVEQLQKLGCDVTTNKVRYHTYAYGFRVRQVRRDPQRFLALLEQALDIVERSEKFVKLGEKFLRESKERAKKRTKIIGG